MINAIIQWSLHNRFFVLLGAIPVLSDVQVIVKTTYPGQTTSGGGGPGDLPTHHSHAVGAGRQNS